MKKVTIPQLIVRKIRSSRWVGRIAMFFGMYVITASIVALETDSITTGLSMGLLGGTIKTGWARIHSLIFTAH